MSSRLARHCLILLSVLPLMSFRMEQVGMPRERLFYDVRGAFVTAPPDVSHELIMETDRLVDEAIRSTTRRVSLPRTILTIRIDRAGHVPLLIGKRHEARVTVEAIAVGSGEPIAEGTFNASAFSIDKDAGEALLAERIARRIAAEFRLEGRGVPALASALSP
jgi:hypothetical protein